MATKTANERYSELNVEVQQKLQVLKVKIETDAMRQAADRGNWGYVGSMAHVNEQLDELLAFLA